MRNFLHVFSKYFFSRPVPLVILIIMPLTEEFVRNWVGDANVFKRGREYYFGNHCANVQYSSHLHELSGRCAGSLGLVYTVLVNLNRQESEIKKAACTCPSIGHKGIVGILEIHSFC